MAQATTTTTTTVTATTHEKVGNILRLINDFNYSDPLGWITHTDSILSSIAAPDDILTITLLSQKIPAEIKLIIDADNLKKSFKEFRDAFLKYFNSTSAKVSYINKKLTYSPKVLPMAIW